MTDTQAPDKILDRVAKLIALATDDRAPQGERDNAMAAAQNLMLKYAIEEAQLRRVGHSSSKPTTRDISLGTAYVTALDCLLAGLAPLFRCRGIRLAASKRQVAADPMTPGSRKNPVVRIFGFEDDVETVELLFRSIELQMVNDCAKNYSGQGRTWKNNYYFGYLSTALARLTENNRIAEESIKTQDTSGSTPGTGLALIKETKDAVDDAVKAVYGDNGLRSQNVSIASDPTARILGGVDGLTADISGGRNNLSGKKGLSS